MIDVRVVEYTNHESLRDRTGCALTSHESRGVKGSWLFAVRWSSSEFPQPTEPVQPASPKNRSEDVRVTIAVNSNRSPHAPPIPQPDPILFSAMVTHEVRANAVMTPSQYAFRRT